ncbi:autotransporter outer membrane beta-barrel domain-containing protein [Fusobacterium sp. PH5-7]|uniref:autotransporter family protein n=1 Tax=Fusobacterium sp. PH5-7 TaxID=2940528 RepID=UPI0024754284|nr:autotransporter outer membrane beta-barrel domain-containing protein [Fusobacterium sp. PH5-7]
MIEKIMKVVKSNNKKRGRNITVGAVVGILLSCTSVMGADVVGLEIKKDGTEIKFSKDTIPFDPNNPEDINNPYPENIWDDSTKTYTNNFTISGTTGYGLRLSGDLGEVCFKNNGIINDDSSSYNACGIILETVIGSIINIGSISGNNESSDFGKSGYGIANFNGKIEIVTNTGSILGKGKNSGYGIVNGNNYGGQGNIGTLTNAGLILGEGTSSSGYGIQNKTGSKIEIITNRGLISGTGTSGYGIESNGSIGAMTNIGLILGTGTTSSSYGISLSGSVDNITNKGSILGEGTGSDVGISGLSNTSLSNAGLISGRGNSSVSGIGISQTMESITNTGIIYGDNCGIDLNYINIANNKAINYGIIANGSSEAPVNTWITITADSKNTDKKKLLNYGLIIKNGTTIDPTIVDTKENPIDVIVGYDDKGNEIVKSMYIKNNLNTDGSGSYTGNSENNSILNALKDTYEVTGTDDKVTGSIINAYENAVVFTEVGKTLTLTDTTVNGGVKETTSAILGSSGADTLVLKNTVVNGNIDMKGGKNLIEAGNNTTINGDIKGGDDADTFTSGNNVVINGEINLGNGKNKIELGNKVYINGDISTGTEGLNFTGGSEVYLNGKVTFTANADIFRLGEKSIIYKDIDMGAGDDELTIGAGSIVNATLAGGDGTDTLTFGKNSGVTPASITEDNTEDSINISHDISGFENINVGAKVTFASDLTITGTSNIALEKDGVLLLTLDKTALDGNGKMTGHALYDSGITVSSTGGRLLLDLDGATAEQIITFGNTNLEESIVPGDKETLDITSKVHTIKAGATPNEMIVVLRWTIPEILKYKGLNRVYHGIGSVNDLIGNFNIKSDEQLVTFIEYLNNIYAGSPYSYSSELSRKSMGMFRDIVTDNQFKANTGKWMIYGGFTHVDGGTKDTYYGKGYYTYDIGSSDMDADTKITGAYMLGEYGVSDTLSSGVVIGGNRMKSDLSNGSKVDGSALYLGAYAKKYVGNLKVTAGAGFQYGNYDADRIAVNKVASSTGEPVMKYSDNYNDITYDIYLNGRYSHQVGDNLFLEPYATLSYTYIDQDGANEGNKTLAIETDSKSFDYTVGKVGVDLKKVIPHEKGKSTLSAGVSYTKILDGADEEHITGRFKGGSDFDILVAHKNEHSIGLNAKYALELENGAIFDVKGTYSIERDSHNGSGKNRTKGEWIVGAGLGYKF